MWNKIVIFLLLIFLVFPKNASSQTVVKEYIDSVPLARNMTITINSKKSNLEIIRWEKTMLWLKVKIAFTNNDLSLARRELQYSRFNLTQTSAGVNINNFFALPSGTDRIQSIISIDYKIYVPDKVTLIINNEYGSCKLSDLNAFISINNKYGEIHLDRITGKTRVYSTLCDIHVVNLSGVSEFDAANSNFYLKNINGTVSIKNKVGNVQFESGAALDNLTIRATQSMINIYLNDIRRFNYNLFSKNAKIDFSSRYRDFTFSEKTTDKVFIQSKEIMHWIDVSTSYNSIKLQ